MIEPELEGRCLDAFPEWLRSLAGDAVDLSQILTHDAAPLLARQTIAGGLNNLFKSLDLIPDGIEDLGFLDDAFVLRVAADLSLSGWPEGREALPVAARLAGDTKIIEDLLGKDYARLVHHVRALRAGAARGRTVD